MTRVFQGRIGFFAVTILNAAFTAGICWKQTDWSGIGIAAGGTAVFTTLAWLGGHATAEADAQQQFDGYVASFHQH